MRTKSIVLRSSVLVVVVFAFSCGDEVTSDGDSTDTTGGDTSNTAGQIAAIWLAQTHVRSVDDPALKLVGNRPAVLKVDVVAANGDTSPPVTVDVSGGGTTETLVLSGPAVLPLRLPSEPGEVAHRYDDSFTAILPARLIRPGLRLSVRVGAAVVDKQIAVGAPTVVAMTMFDVYYFGRGVGGNYPSGWDQELAAKWPVAELRVQRVPNLLFDTLVIPARAGVGAARVSSPAEYKDKTGLNFDGEQGAALRWVGALRAASGQSNLALYFVNIYGVNAGGQAGGFQGVGNGTAIGILHHELGHALSLPHWGDNAEYPYKGDMFGIPAPDVYKGTHAGPTWAFDLPTTTFIPPTVQAENVGNRPEGTYKADPMQGGGSGDQERGFLLRHFSDYSTDRMQGYLERTVVVHNPADDSYARWDQSAGDYSDPRTGNGVTLPLENNVAVVSVMASTSMADPEVNLVYPPIGPYQGGLIRTFDPSVASDRSLAGQIYCPAGGCDYSLRVVQGGVERIYMLRASGNADDDPLSSNSLGTAAVNLRAADGEIARIELLATPNAETAGVPQDAAILDSWVAP